MAFILNLIVFVNLLLLFLFLFIGKKNVVPNKILALILLVPGLNFLSNTIILNGNIDLFPYLFFFTQMMAFTFAPLVFSYSRLLTIQTVQVKHPLFILSIFAMLMNLGFGAEYFFMTKQEQQLYLEGLTQEPYTWQQALVNAVFIVLQQIYFTITSIDIYKYHIRISNRLSDFGKTKFAYIKRFMILIWLLNLITLILYGTLPMHLVEYYILPLVLLTINFFILYYAFHYNALFTPQSYEQFIEDNAIKEIDIEEIEDVEIEENSTTDTNEMVALVVKIERCLTDNELYLKQDITIDEFSRLINENPVKVSAAINKEMGINFFDLINRKRIEKSILLLKEKHASYTIEAIALEAGFNSRASFYRAFKKHTGLTPKEIIENIKK
jgi:AraC-like DNA-binding protein